MPEELFVSAFIDGKHTVGWCPICTMTVINTIHGLPADTPLRGEMAAQMVEDAWEYYKPTKKDPYNFLKGGEIT